MSDDYDPFECRLEFTSLLQKLNASQQSIQKVANYAMRNKRLSEDLYSCVLESLEQVSFDPT
jgi:CTD kinase subunit gamma